MIITLILLSFILFSEYQRDGLEFIVFSVGQGDSILIRTLSRRDILIDGGPDNTLVYKLGQYLPFYDREIDLIILTHPHSDHVIGLIEVLKRYQVKKVLMTGVKYYSAEYLAFEEEILKRHIPVEVITHRGEMLLDRDTKLDIIFPNQSFFDKENKNLNNTSIVAKLIYASSSIMLTGDFEDEENLVAKDLDLSADILKVGHHGSRTANSLDFLAAVNPKIAVISSGLGNKFDHPHQETLENLKKLGISIYRTDSGGDYFQVLKK